jgi:3-oxoacyl-[acyl-carrier protein] reductase
MDLKLHNKTALVMGSSAGIGKAIAESLIAEGVRVCLCSRTEESLQKTCSEIGAETYVVADLSKAGEGERATKEAISKLGKLDVIVTNTGGPAKGSFADISNDQWFTDFQSLWMSVVESWKVALPSMKENNYGRLLLVTSIAAKEPLAGLTTSNGLRAGLAGLVRSVATEYAHAGITFNCLLPGYTNTDRLKALNLSDEKVKSMVPAGRLGEPQEIADLCTFLASEKAGYITAQSIAVDGGVLKGL